MISRRGLVVGSACTAAAGAAYILKPRRELSLLGDRSLEDIVPRTFGPWTSQDVSGLVAPKIEGSLAARLYSQTVGRIYQNGATGGEIMMLLAHGQSSTDDLQLHRPESCYPAFGFTLSGNQPTKVVLARGVDLPVRRLVADAPGRRENIMYWSRIGEYLPTSRDEQRRDRLRTSMDGYIADGLLARFSALGDDTRRSLSVISAFIPELIAATPLAGRGALVGTQLAKTLAAAGK